jgi:hypothetical protein
MQERRTTAALAVCVVLAACGDDNVTPVARATFAGTDTSTAGPDFAEKADLPPAPDLAAPADVAEKRRLPDTFPTPQIHLVAPNSGPVDGMNEVRVTGKHLTGVDKVVFGDALGLGLQVLHDGELVVVAPPHPAGLVDVWVKRPEAQAPEGRIAFGYRYVAPVEVHAAKPASGPAQGGTLVTVTGKGFQKGMALAFGSKLALAVQVIDDNTVTCLTPPGTPGPQRIVAHTPDGNGILRDGFTFHAHPTLALALPAVGPLAGGIEVELRGTGLVVNGAAAHLVRGKTVVKATVLGATADATRLHITVPTLPAPGTWDVRYTNAAGEATLADGYTCFDPALAAPLLPMIHAASPAAQPVNRVAPVTVAVRGGGLKPDSEVTVLFGSDPATVLQILAAEGGATIVVQPPKPVLPMPTPLAVDVMVAVGTTLVAKPGAFTWLPAWPEFTQATPNVLPLQGGVPLQLAWTAPPAAWGKPLGVRVGALPCGQVTWKPLGASCLAPAGTPGKADVIVQFAGSASALAPKLAESGLVQYAGAPGLAVLVPPRGSQAGGTLVDVLGTDLRGVKEIWLGGFKASEMYPIDAGLVRIRTPPGKPGPVVVGVLFGGGQPSASLPNGYVYFDPRAGDYGSWGDPIDGALNVTVVNRSKGVPIEGATVVIGHDPQTALKGLTDARGQVTLSALGLKGPLHVHATKAGLQAGSVVALAVENVTIRLSVLPKPGGAVPEPVAPLPDGWITGTAVDVEKYAPLPLGSCAGNPVVAGNCKPCTLDTDCAFGTVCQALATPKGTAASPLSGEDLSDDVTDTVAQHCAKPCATDADCPSLFECRSVGISLENANFRCVPRIGVRQTRCETSGPSIFGGFAPPGPGGIANSSGKFVIASHPGDVAVVCRAGYIASKTAEFVPLAIGLARGYFMIPGGGITGVVVHVKHPLDRKLRVRMDALPQGPGLRSLTAGLYLGGEGYVRVADPSTWAEVDGLGLERQPHVGLFDGDNADIRYEIYGGLSSKLGAPPSSTAVVTEVDPRGLDRPLMWPVGAKGPSEAEHGIGTVHALHDSGDLRVAVGDAGRIAHWTGANFTLQPSPTALALHAVWLAPNAQDGWIGGASGVLLRWTAYGWKLWGEAAERPVVALAGRVANDAWLVDEGAQLQHWDGQQWTPFAGPVSVADALPPKGSSGQPAPAPKQVHAAWHAPEGTLWLVGDGGGLWQGKLDSAGVLALQPVATGTLLSLRGVWGTSDFDLWLAGDRGRLGHFDGKSVTWLPTPTQRALLAVRAPTGKGPVHAVGAQGTWLRIDGNKVSDFSVPDQRIDLRGLFATGQGNLVAAGEPVLALGPYLEMPFLVEPKPDGKLGVRLRWTALPGHTPMLNIARLADMAYNTRWEIFVRGTVDTVDLPDFTQFGETTPLPAGDLMVRLWRVLASGLEIDHFNAKLLNSWSWTSWSYNTATVKRIVKGASAPQSDAPDVQPPGAPQPPPLPK